MTELTSNNKIIAQNFHSKKRFQDLCAINEGGEFGHINADIYPKELDIKPEYQGTHASFLNRDVIIVDGKFIYKLYGKRDSFPFLIVTMPYTVSNIPNNNLYSVFVGVTLALFIQLYISLIFSQEIVHWYQQYRGKEAKHKIVIHF